MYTFKCYTRQGHWTFQAHDHLDAMRLALFYCWRDAEDFIRVEFYRDGKLHSLKVLDIEQNGTARTLS